jgi:hypothetical protein
VVLFARKKKKRVVGRRCEKSVEEGKTIPRRRPRRKPKPNRAEDVPDSLSPDLDVIKDIRVVPDCIGLIFLVVGFPHKHRRTRSNGLKFALVDCKNTSTTMILQGLAIVFFLVWYFLLRPRGAKVTKGDKITKNAVPPPMVRSNNGIPIIGVLIEFFKSPNTMVQRCYQDYGGVFTIPVRFCFRFDFRFVAWQRGVRNVFLFLVMLGWPRRRSLAHVVFSSFFSPPRLFITSHSFVTNA